MNPGPARWIAPLAIAAACLLPMGLALPLALVEAGSAAAWAEVGSDPRLPGAFAATLVSAGLGTALSLLLTLALITHLHGTAAWRALVRTLAPMLAVPHAAFAIGLAWLVAPAGWIARGLAPTFGWAEPPPWNTVHDALGLSLAAVLVLKETPFLLWSAAALLARPDVALAVQRQLAAGRSLGHARAAVWWRAIWPQWLPRMAWPLLAVAAYSLTVVDLAIVIGPSTPPTLAAWSYAELADGSADNAARGSVLAVVLAGLVAAAAGVGFAAHAAWQRAMAARAAHGPARARRGAVASWSPSMSIAMSAWAPAAALLPAVALAVIGALLVLSVAGAWPFPAAWPPVFTAAAWRLVAEAFGTVGFTAALAVAATLVACALVVAWLESAPPSWDTRGSPLVLAPLVLPGLLWMSGLYQLALRVGLDGTVAGLVWAHALCVLPYAWITLQPAWRSFDPRWQAVARSLGRGRAVFFVRVKLPLLAAPLASALAVGFAVSVAQYLATQFLGAGRHATVTTEAVTLASGGQRSVAAAFALVQAALPVLAFGAAAWVGARAAARVSPPGPGVALPGAPAEGAPAAAPPRLRPGKTA